MKKEKFIIEFGDECGYYDIVVIEGTTSEVKKFAEQYNNGFGGLQHQFDTEPTITGLEDWLVQHTITL